ncbi:hypothetical protein BDV06DRAFT_88719 [Aspergillus oleicola]
MASLTRKIPRVLPRAPASNARSTLQIRAAAFSTRAIYLEKLPSSTPNQKEQPVNPEVPRFSFEGLGISKNVKIVLYTLLSIWGTFETYFYYQALMRWWRARNEPEEVESDD